MEDVGDPLLAGFRCGTGRVDFFLVTCPLQNYWSTIALTLSKANSRHFIPQTSILGTNGRGGFPKKMSRCDWSGFPSS